jgi:hypothetical protein
MAYAPFGTYEVDIVHCARGFEAALRSESGAAVLSKSVLNQILVIFSASPQSALQALRGLRSVPCASWWIPAGWRVRPGGVADE